MGDVQGAFALTPLAASTRWDTAAETAPRHRHRLAPRHRVAVVGHHRQGRAADVPHACTIGAEGFTAMDVIRTPHPAEG